MPGETRWHGRGEFEEYRRGGSGQANDNAVMLASDVEGRVPVRFDSGGRSSLAYLLVKMRGGGDCGQRTLGTESCFHRWESRWFNSKETKEKKDPVVIGFVTR